MIEYADTAKEALRILRRVSVAFNDGSQKTGSGFVAGEAGKVITCAHVVSETGTTPKQITVNGKESKLAKVLPDIDLAVLACEENDVSRLGTTKGLEIGSPLLFSGFPAGVTGPSVFSGILSSHGKGLIEFPRCRVLQINGMINSGNSGGPVFKVGSPEVIGVVTAKYVPLLKEIDNLRDILRNIPQFPSEVGIGNVDFSKFVNLTVRALRSISGSLRLVQIGTGYAVPIDVTDK